MQQPKPKLEIISYSHKGNLSSLDAFQEDRVQRDLARLANAPGLFAQYAERARTRFQKAGERAILEHWIAFYEAGNRLIAARTAMERNRSEYLQLTHEHELSLKKKGVERAKGDADIEEHHTRAAKARSEREIEEATTRSRIEAIKNPLKASDPPQSPSREEQRFKKVAAIETTRNRYRQELEERKRIARTPQEAKRWDNFYADAENDLDEELKKWLR